MTEKKDVIVEPTNFWDEERIRLDNDRITRSLSRDEIYPRVDQTVIQTRTGKLFKHVCPGCGYVNWKRTETDFVCVFCASDVTPIIDTPELKVKKIDNKLYVQFCDMSFLEAKSIITQTCPDLDIVFVYKTK